MNDGAVTIAVAGAKNRLRFFWAVNGSATWHAETVAGARTTYSAPSITENDHSANISAVGASQRLKFYWAADNTPTWHPETVAGPGSVR